MAMPESSVQQGEKHELSDDGQVHEKPDEAMTDAPHTKKKAKSRPHHVIHQATLRKPSWTYFHLQLFTTSPKDSIDVVTAKGYLNVAMQRFLGLHGLAVPMDILKHERLEVWIRVPREDGPAVHEAMSSWTGDGVKWVVKGRDDWLVRLAGGGNGQDLFRT